MHTCFSIDPLTIDPRKCGDPITSTFLSLIYDSLVRLKPDGGIELALAKSLFVSEDQKTYRFYLRESYWSDGHPLTATDFEYSWKRALDPQFPTLSPQLFFPILKAESAARGLVPIDEVGIQAIDERTLEIKLHRPTPYFLSVLSCSNFYPIPKHVEKKDPAWENAPETQILSSGPFQISHWKRKNEILCKKNPLYWDVANVNLESIQISIINNPYAALQLFDQEELDLVSVILCSLPFETLEPYRENGKLKLFPAGGTFFCSFNLHQFPFHNQNIRKAFSYAIDRNYIVEHISRFNEVPAYRCLPPCLVENEEEILFPKCNEFLARKHLDEGLRELRVTKNGDQELNLRLFINNLTLAFVSNQLNSKIVLALQDQWKKVLGFKVRLESCDYHSFIHRFNQGKYSMGLASWLAQFNDPMTIFERFTCRSLLKNFPGYENRQFNDLLHRSSFATSAKERKRILKEAESLFLEDMPLSPIYHFNHAFLCNPQLKGVQMNPIGGFHFNRCEITRRQGSEHPIAVS